MSLVIATHDGNFHADDVLAAAMLRHFVDEDAIIVRTRDVAALAEADVVFDVGHVFDPARRRFDHHQREYEGNRSSAGMVLDHLEEGGYVDSEIAGRLRAELVDYVDAIDTGKRRSDEGVPCFSMVIGVLNENANEDFDRWFARGVEIARDVVRGLVRSVERAREAADLVRTSMREAEEAGSKILRLPRYVKWKPAYYAEGGAEHITEFALFCGNPEKSDWRLLTIAVEEGSLEDKRKLPSEWGGLEGAELEEAIGVKGARFCHRNCFIAGFSSEEAALEALAKWDLA